MNNKDLQKITDNIQEKLGKENAGIIADDLGLIITENTNSNKLLEQKDKEIERLKNANELLALSNGQLLQQVGMGDEPEKEPEEEQPKKIIFNNLFDDKGNFIK